MRTAARRQMEALVAETRDLDENTLARSLGVSLMRCSGTMLARPGSAPRPSC
jgi:hypothetical protein